VLPQPTLLGVGRRRKGAGCARVCTGRARGGGWKRATANGAASSQVPGPSKWPFVSASAPWSYGAASSQAPANGLHGVPVPVPPRHHGTTRLSTFELDKGPPKKKTKKQGTKKQSRQKTTDRLSFLFLFFLGAPCVGCGPSVDIPPHVGTRSWLWGLPLYDTS
jgi:hypothetical protein